MDTSVEFAGISFPNPFLLASAPPSGNGEMIRRAFKAGWGGAVTKTIMWDAAVDVSPRFSSLKDPSGNVFGFGNIELTTRRPLGAWLDDIRQIKEDYPERPLVVSLMAESVRESWQGLARSVQDAGADALELNLSCPHGMPEKGMGMAVGQDPDITAMVTGWVSEVARVPVIVKLSPNVTDICAIANAAKGAGASAISAVNTVSGLLGVDIDSFEPLPSVGGYGTFCGYSGAGIKPIALRCVAQIAASTGLPVSAIGGIRSWRDAVEFMLLGASTVQLGTEVMLRGYSIIGHLKRGLREYMESHGFQKVSDVIGLALPRLKEYEALDKGYRVRARIDPERCNGCLDCVTACRDGGYSAINLGEDRKPVVHEAACDGCSLCLHVCPVAGCIRLEAVMTT